MTVLRVEDLNEKARQAAECFDRLVDDAPALEGEDLRDMRRLLAPVKTEEDAA